MEWNLMKPVGTSFCLGDWVEGTYIVGDDCEAILDEMIEALLQEDKKTLAVRRRMSLERVIENDLVPLLKVCDDGDAIFSKAVRLMANLTQPLETCIRPASTSSATSSIATSSTSPCTSSSKTCSPTASSSSSSPPSHRNSSSPSSSSPSSSSSPPRISERYGAEISSLIDTAKVQCSDLEFLKSLGANMRNILDKETLKSADCVCLNHCILLLRNLFHIRSNTSSTEQASLSHQCLSSSFFVTELDKVIFTMLNHKLKETWTIGLAQLISFLFKDYSASLLEPDIDECAPATQSGDGEGSSQETTSGSDSSLRRSRTASSRSGARGAAPLGHNLTSKFKKNLQICSATEKLSSCSSGSDDDDFLLEFKSTADGRLEIKLTNCPQQQQVRKESPIVTSDVSGPSRSGASGGSGSGSRSVEDMDVLEGGGKGSSGSGGSNKGTGQCKGQGSDQSSCQMSGQSGDGDQASGESSPTADQGSPEVTTTTKDNLQENPNNISLCCTSRIMDMDIIVSYLKKFATEIMYSGFVDLVENIMRALMTKYDSVLDHSFLMWTVGFFLSFAHQQELDFDKFKEVLNLDLIGYLVYEAVLSCEAMEVKRFKKQDIPVEKHRVHLVVCTLNQLFRTLMTHSKMEYLVDLQKCLVHMRDLHQLFVLLIRLQVSTVQGVVYLRDLVQTNHVLTLMLEQWMARGFTEDVSGFSMLEHIRQFATRPVMAKYGSLLEQTELNRDTVNVAVLTMMYHVAGDCKRQDTLMQLPILKAFSEIWVENVLSDHAEFNDLVEFVLEMFMSYAENDPNACAHNLLDSQPCEERQDNNATDDGGGESGDGGSGSGSGVGDAESSMNIGSSSNCSAEDFSDEEQNLIFAWITELEGEAESGGCANGETATDFVYRKLRDCGFSKSKEQITKYLQDNGFIEAVSSPVSPFTSASSSSQSSPSSNKKEQLPSSSSSPTQALKKKSSANLSSDLPEGTEEDGLIPVLLDKLKLEGFEPQLKWFQKQLLEAAYVKLVMKDSSQRKHVEEPVAKFHALQNKAIPIVAWSDELEEALNHPYFQLLQKSLGLIIQDRSETLFSRIPAFFTPSMLVGKATQIGPLDSVLVKFDVSMVKEESSSPQQQDMSTGIRDTAKQSDLDNGRTGGCGQSMDANQLWLRAIQKMNGEMDVSGN